MIQNHLLRDDWKQTFKYVRSILSVAGLVKISSVPSKFIWTPWLPSTTYNHCTQLLRLFLQSRPSGSASFTSNATIKVKDCSIRFHLLKPNVDCTECSARQRSSPSFGADNTFSLISIYFYSAIGSIFLLTSQCLEHTSLFCLPS